ncbi:MAG: HNH endonuclease [Methanocorpusculum sp.]|nr:HNH endonuclease [Methanocorpusculum sp.]MDE2523144.1 HNH endonuclease [Methanocorpusculum sp.]MDE2525008.1 HNH endonuclease [Methanocorpusculum sp.]
MPGKENFSQETIDKTWEKQEGHCLGCGKQLVKKNRGRQGRGCWEAHHSKARQDDGTGHTNNCVILCCSCHKKIHPKDKDGNTRTLSIRELQELNGYHPKGNSFIDSVLDFIFGD